MTDALYAACGKGPDESLLDWIADARARTIKLVDDLTDDQLRVAKLEIVNPLDWEIGHAAYFSELFALRAVDDRAPRLADADALFDSIAIEHDVRWDLPLPDRAQRRIIDACWPSFMKTCTPRHLPTRARLWRIRRR